MRERRKRCDGREKEEFLMRLRTLKKMLPGAYLAVYQYKISKQLTPQEKSDMYNVVNAKTVDFKILSELEGVFNVST